MNIVLLTPEDNIHNSMVILHDERFQHIRHVLKSSAGDTIRVGQLNGLMGDGFIQAIDDNHVKLSIKLSQPSPPKLPLTIILALPRPAMLQRIIRNIAELGIKQLILTNSFHVEKSFWHSQALQPSVVRRHLITGLQQAKDTVLPIVTFKKALKPFIEDELPTLTAAHDYALIAHPNSSKSCPHQTNHASTLLAIGPEAGFTTYEVNQFVEAGCTAAHIGQRILRVENAVTALISRLVS